VSFQSGDAAKVRAAERPQSLNIARSSGYVAGGSVLPMHGSGGGGVPSQQTPGTSSSVRLLSDSRCDIVEQSLRAANVLSDYPNPGSLVAQPHAAPAASLSLACTPTSSSSISSSVAHPLGSGVDCVLDYSQQQRLNRRRHNDDIANNNNNNNSVFNCGRRSLSDIVTPTSDVTTASSPSESLSQVNRYIG